MSRLAKKPIAIPAKVTVESSMTDVLTVQGSKATLSRTIHSSIAITVDSEGAHIKQKDSTRLGRALTGTFAAHLRAMIAGVETPFKKVLELNGVGYKVELKGSDLGICSWIFSSQLHSHFQQA
jgi:large subunit ribosomal protein L6